MDFTCIFTDFVAWKLHGFSLILFYDFPWIFIFFHNFYMDVHGCCCMDFHEISKIVMDFHECSLILHGFSQILLHGFSLTSWIFMHFALIFIDFVTWIFINLPKVETASAVGVLAVYPGTGYSV